MILPDLAQAESSTTPFPHFISPDVISSDVAGAALRWLRDDAQWELRVEDFYEQHELDLTFATGDGIAALAAPEFVAAIRDAAAALLPTEGELELVGVTAHRLTAGQTIRIHNDHIGKDETHRVLIQLNEGWKPENGGFLMLFSDDRPEAVAEVVAPAPASAFGFRISATSHHAVSTVRGGERFTVVYTFRQTA
ncbi:cyclophane-containing peptide 2OG-Fe(II) oxygenase YhhC [Sphingomonas sp. BE138]|uniref:cyclophane-containing peptide 2OG-Fe(II) oxygenase YhhC n=1 Tax=Sphingomonas sp. BE138 TaxID=2817845 RepID=UPI00286CFCE5|nr:cyclophane-containing peptide 2OG-Fe(II) oxygenase YhhC [Sphingomonas sp. BE138]